MPARPQPVTVAAILLAPLSLPNVLNPLLALEGELVPLIYLTVAFGVAGLIAAAGAVDAQAVGIVAHHHSLPARRHLLLGSGDPSGSDCPAPGACGGCSCGLGSHHCASVAAHLATGLHLTLEAPPKRTSQNSVKRKFGEIPFHALG
jgi:hypothetical protein